MSSGPRANACQKAGWNLFRHARKSFGIRHDDWNRGFTAAHRRMGRENCRGAGQRT